MVTGQPLVCPLQLREGRTRLFQLLCRKLPPVSCRLLLFGLLSGRPINIQGDIREEEIRQSLTLLLPRPPQASPVRDQAQPWAALSVRTAAGPLPASRSSVTFGDAAGWPGGDLNAVLICPSCSCDAAGAKSAAAVCAACGPAGSSTLVARWMRIVRSEELSLPAWHMRMVTTVAETAVQAKAWARLRSTADRADFLKRLGFAKSDAEIFDLYKILL